jgi:glycosyltransferase involved in cell wall biosynthesis
MEIIYLQKLFNKRSPKLIIFYHMDISYLSPLKHLLSFSGKVSGKKLLQQADKIIVSSYDYVKNSQIKELYHKQTTKFTAIPFSIDTNKFVAENKFKTTNKANFNLLFVGGLDKAHYFKGVDILIKSLANIKNSNWQLNIIGSGDLLVSLKALVKKLKIIHKINFLEKVSNEELINAYQKADILLLPSTNSHEAFGLVIIEAMACATAIIASDLPGVRTVFSKKSGLRTLPGNVKDLENKLKYLLDNPDVIYKMKLNARLEAEERYSLEIAKKNWLNALL